jgi:hypothetical protein
VAPRVSEPEHKCRFPTFCARERGEGGTEVVIPSEHLIAVDHLDGLIERLPRQPLCGERQMQTLPSATGRNRLRHVQSVSHEDHAEGRRRRGVHVSRQPQPEPIDCCRLEIWPHPSRDRHEPAGAGRIDRHPVAAC